MVNLSEELSLLCNYLRVLTVSKLRMMWCYEGRQRRSKWLSEWMRLMLSEREEKTCAHIPCSCVVPPGENYCSQECEDAGSDDVEIACECGHETCALGGEEREERSVA